MASRRLWTRVLLAVRVDASECGLASAAGSLLDKKKRHPSGALVSVPRQDMGVATLAE